jgi:hypothetical protein
LYCFLCSNEYSDVVFSYPCSLCWLSMIRSF